jgi:1-deoxy-D-xylulose-5-phosphate reductoisomerase
VAAKLGRTYPAVLSAADEVAVRAFLEKRINFTRIPAVIEKVLLRHKAVSAPDLSDIIQADRWAREETHSLC